MILFNTLDVTSYISDFLVANKLNERGIDRTCDGTLNVGEYTYYYLPVLKFSFVPFNEAFFISLMEIINQPDGFSVTFYDYTLGETVTRQMKMTQEQIGMLYFSQGDMSRIGDFTFEAVCVNGFEDYDALKGETT